MKYTDSKGKPINSFKEWENLFLENPKKKKHWQENRSAYSLASFMFNENGKEFIDDLVSEIIGEKVNLHNATPELETKFDIYKNGREHDLGIWGQTKSGQSMFIGVESKVDEKFNCKISEAYIVAKTKELNKTSTKAPNRIEELLIRSFGTIKKSHWNLMYQLFYTLFGTLDAKNNGLIADVPVMLFIVFKTSSYVDNYGLRNYNDYKSFINHLDAVEIKSSRRNVDAHIITLKGKSMYSIYCQL